MNKKRFSSAVDLAEEGRHKKISEIYLPAFQSLSENERMALAFSGDVWWNHSNIAKNEIILHQKTLDLLEKADSSRPEPSYLSGLLNKDSLLWKAFQLDMTHHSTSIEGNKLTVNETALVLNEFAETISRGQGIGNKYDIAPNQLHGLPKHDVVEVVNHAAAMNFIRDHWYNEGNITVEKIQDLFDILMPQSKEGSVDATQWPPSHKNFRTISVGIKGSSMVCPYPQEVGSNVRRILDWYYTVDDVKFHPIVSITLFMMNFIHVHPFFDGNGRMSRLLLMSMLFNKGYLGCLFRKDERKLFFSHFDPYILHGDPNPMIYYIAGRIYQFHNDLKLFNSKSDCTIRFS